MRSGKARTRRLTVLQRALGAAEHEALQPEAPQERLRLPDTRDGTKLAINVRLPAGPGPYPTLIEYAGYGYADPAGAQSGISPIANLLGFAVVDVNMRGTGCSGGAFDFFEPLQGLDGYDVIETVARQPWVAHNKVGMMGISYGGISQLFVAATRPPSLAAITPLSVIDDTQTTLYPGGILNTGFTSSGRRTAWTTPSPPQTAARRGRSSGSRTATRPARPTRRCTPRRVDLLKKVRRNNYYRPEGRRPAGAASKFVDKIDVPVFLACQFTDEQTGGHCPTLASRFTGTTRSGSPSPTASTPTRSTRRPSTAGTTSCRSTSRSETPRADAATRGPRAGGLPGGARRPRRDAARDPIQARADLRRRAGRLRGAAAGAGPVRQRRRRHRAGRPYPGFEQSFSSFPVPATERVWFLGARRRARATRAGRRRAAPTPSPGTRRRARPTTSRATPAAPAACGRRRPPYDWTPEPRRDAPSPT